MNVLLNFEKDLIVMKEDDKFTRGFQFTCIANLKN